MKFIYLCILIALTSGCAGSSGGSSDPNKQANRSVYNDGRCTPDFLTDYNDIKYAFDLAKPTLNSQYASVESKRVQLQSIQNACLKLQKNNPGISCRAEVNYKETTIATSDRKEACEVVDKLLADESVSPAPKTGNTDSATGTSTTTTSSTELQKPSDESGKCNYGFVSSYNEVAVSVRSADAAIKSSYNSRFNKLQKLLAAQKDCQKLTKTYSSETCNALINYEQKQISVEDRKTACSAIDRLVIEYSSTESGQ